MKSFSCTTRNLICQPDQEGRFCGSFGSEARIIHFEGGATHLNTVFDKPSKFFFISSQLAYSKLHLKLLYPVLWAIHFGKSALAYSVYSLKKNQRRKVYWLNYLFTVCGKPLPAGASK